MGGDMPDRDMLLQLETAAQIWSGDPGLGSGRQAMARTVARYARELAQRVSVSDTDMDTLRLMTCHLYRHLQPRATTGSCPFGTCDTSRAEDGARWFCSPASRE